MTYVYVALNPNGLIKIGTTTNPEARRARFNNIPEHRKNAKMEIKKVIPLQYDGRTYALAVESLLRQDLQTYNTTNTTMDTFAYNGAYFKPNAYIKAFDKKVAKAEKILSHTKTTGHLL